MLFQPQNLPIVKSWGQNRNVLLNLLHLTLCFVRSWADGPNQWGFEGSVSWIRHEKRRGNWPLKAMVMDATKKGWCLSGHLQRVQLCPAFAICLWVHMKWMVARVTWEFPGNSSAGSFEILFQVITMLSEAKENARISVNPITREDVISAPKFCKIIA